MSSQNLQLEYHTDRLIIRPTNEEDAGFIFKLMNQPKWLANIGDRKLRSIADAGTYIQEKIKPQFQRLGFGNNTIILKSDGTKIGTCGLYDREGIDGVDIGFALLTKYEKKGYAFEAASKVMELGMNSFKQNKVSGITLPSNVASQNLLKKLGLQYKEMIRIPNDDEELMLFCNL